MTKPDDIESDTGLDIGRNDGEHPAGGVADALARVRRALEPARSVLAAAGPLGAALWALYPVAIMLLVIGFLFAGAGSI